jgi:two-component system, OmpR family, alkaline phosphatase synthesis response regulator PhoP
VGKQDPIDNQILELVKQNPDITESEIASKLGLRKSDVRRRIEQLSDTRTKILVVDDEKDITDSLGISLESEGYKVVKANTGHDAIEKARVEIPDLILLDIMLPDMNGYEITNKLRKDPLTKLIPIIMLTGRGGLNDKIEGLDLGADDYITKPFNVRELKARVRTVLRRSMV